MDKPIKIYLVRHGQTAMNVDKVFRGRLDPSLNKTGHEEARATAALLKSADISFIISSPLLRAVQTAEPIARLHNLDVKIVRELIDIDFGKWQGLKEKSAMRRNSRLLGQWHHEPHKVTFPGGENLIKVKKRLEVFLENITTPYMGRSGVVVTHRVVCKVFVCLLTGIPLKNFWNVKIDTASVSVFELERARAVIHFLNETCHLKKLGKNRVLHDF